MAPFGLMMSHAQAAEEDSTATASHDWTVKEIRLNDGEHGLKKGFLLSPPDDRSPRAVSEEVGKLVQSGALDPEQAYSTARTATKAGRDGNAIADKEDEKESEHSGGVQSENDRLHVPPASGKFSIDAAPEKVAQKEEAQIPAGDGELQLPQFSDWKIRRVSSEEKGKGEVFSLKPPDDRPAGHISGPVAHRLFGGGLDAETAYRMAVFGSSSKSQARGGDASPSNESASMLGKGGGASRNSARSPASAKSSGAGSSRSSSAEDPSAASAAPAAEAADKSTSTATASQLSMITVGSPRSVSRRCVAKAAGAATKQAAAKPAPAPVEPPSNKVIQGISEIWMDQPGAHRSTVTPQANCPRGYSAHPYYDDGSGLGGIIGDVGYNGFMGGGVFFCVVTDPDADKIVTDVLVTSSKSSADACPSDYEAKHVIADCSQGFGAACSVPVLLQNFCVKKEPISTAKFAVKDFGITPTITAGLAHVSDLPCPEGYKTVGETTSCGGAAAYCAGKQKFCMKVTEIPVTKAPSAVGGAPTSELGTGSTPEVVCLEDDSGSKGEEKGESENPPSDITGTNRKKTK